MPQPPPWCIHKVVCGPLRLDAPEVSSSPHYVHPRNILIQSRIDKLMIEFFVRSSNNNTLPTVFKCCAIIAREAAITHLTSFTGERSEVKSCRRFAAHLAQLVHLKGKTIRSGYSGFVGEERGIIMPFGIECISYRLYLSSSSIKEGTIYTSYNFEEMFIKET